LKNKFNFKMRHKIIFTIVLMISLISNSVFAQIESSGGGGVENGFIILGIIVGCIFGAIFFWNIRKLSLTEGAPRRETAFTKLLDKLSGSVPIEKEKDIMMEHEFDGIRELDNTIPPWFNILFYGTIVIALLYILNYHVLKLSPLSAEEYGQEMRIAAAEREELIKTGAFINENTVKLLKDDAILTEGKNIFTSNCIVCHGPGGGGIIGPNLTDDYWIHGGSISNVFTTIKYGVPIKGMLSWQNQLNPKQIQAVANYILTLKGTNPPNGKPPEGQIFIDTTTKAADTVKIKTDTKNPK